MFVDLVLRLLHILPAVFLAGGIFFMWSTLNPALATLADEARNTTSTAVRGKWAKVVMASSGLLLVSGLINAFRNILAFEYTGAPYHVFVLLKLLLALAIMFITARLSGRSAGAEKFREKMSLWMTVNTVLLVVLITVASAMRVTERVPKSDDEIDIPVVIEPATP